MRCHGNTHLQWPCTIKERFTGNLWPKDTEKTSLLVHDSKNRSLPMTRSWRRSRLREEKFSVRREKSSKCLPFLGAFHKLHSTTSFSPLLSLIFQHRTDEQVFIYKIIKSFCFHSKYLHIVKANEKQIKLKVHKKAFMAWKKLRQHIKYLLLLE